MDRKDLLEMKLHESINIGRTENLSISLPPLPVSILRVCGGLIYTIINHNTGHISSCFVPESVLYIPHTTPEELNKAKWNPPIVPFQDMSKWVMPTSPTSMVSDHIADVNKMVDHFADAGKVIQPDDITIPNNIKVEELLTGMDLAIRDSETVTIEFQLNDGRLEISQVVNDKEATIRNSQIVDKEVTA